MICPEGVDQGYFVTDDGVRFVKGAIAVEQVCRDPRYPYQVFWSPEAVFAEIANQHRVDNVYGQTTPESIEAGKAAASKALGEMQELVP